jgi:hypothetical protein
MSNGGRKCGPLFRQNSRLDFMARMRCGLSFTFFAVVSNGLRPAKSVLNAVDGPLSSLISRTATMAKDNGRQLDFGSAASACVQSKRVISVYLPYDTMPPLKGSKVGDISQILKGIGAAATNPLALAAYVAAVSAWVVIQFRVLRNNNLLKQLTSLPEDARLPALRDEMGVVPLKEGISPEQWLRSRTHSYYFIGFLVLCAVLVVLFAISAYTIKAKAEIESKIPRNNTSLPDPPEQQFSNKLQDIDLGVDRAYVESKLGQPRHSSKLGESVACTDYESAFAKVKFLFFKDKALFIYVVRKGKTFQPSFFSYTSLPSGKDCLGCFPFRDLTREISAAPTPEDPNPAWPDNPASDRGPEVMFYNLGGSAVPFLYVERYLPTYRWQRLVFLINTGQGYNDEIEVDGGEAFRGVTGILERWQESKISDFDSYFGQLPTDDKIKFAKSRGSFKPNAYALLATDDSGEKDYEKNVPGYAELADGDVDTADCE